MYFSWHGYCVSKLTPCHFVRIGSDFFFLNHLFSYYFFNGGLQKDIKVYDLSHMKQTHHNVSACLKCVAVAKNTLVSWWTIAITPLPLCHQLGVAWGCEVSTPFWVLKQNTGFSHTSHCGWTSSTYVLKILISKEVGTFTVKVRRRTIQCCLQRPQNQACPRWWASVWHLSPQCLLCVWWFLLFEWFALGRVDKWIV